MYNVTELTDYFGYLDGLRESGELVFDQAPSYLKLEFGISKREAFDVLATWRSTFDDNTLAERATKYVTDKE